VTIPTPLVRRVLAPLAAYALLEWLFAYVTTVEGLVTPRASLNVEVVAIGCAYLALRMIVRVLLPGIAAFALADLAWRFLVTKGPRRLSSPKH